jgi:nucleoside-diphosphate-sugar epimerase
MRVFVTGATGFIGSAVVKELIAAGHQVVGLCRSDEKAAALAAAGAEVHRGSLEDLDSLKAGAARSDGVIHLAFNHDFSKFAANCEDDRRLIKALGSVLAGSGRPLIVTSGTGMANTVPGQPATEDGAVISSDVIPRAASEEAAAAVAADGVNVSVVRLPQVHDTVRQGLVTYTIAIAREKGVCAYLGDGHNRWPAAHLLDVARLYRLAIEKGATGCQISCGRGSRRLAPGYCSRHRPTFADPGQIHRPGRGSSLFRLARDVCRPRHACLKRTDAEKAGMAADRARTDCRPRTIARLRSLKLAGVSAETSVVCLGESASASRSSVAKTFWEFDETRRTKAIVGGARSAVKSALTIKPRTGFSQ